MSQRPDGPEIDELHEYVMDAIGITLTLNTVLTTMKWMVMPMKVIL